jgi:hypothetical protein
VLAYCRTIHKAQGSTYHGQSFTLAGDDTIHLEAVHVAMSRGTRANTLYYIGQPPPDEDHHAAEVAEPEFESLVVGFPTIPLDNSSCYATFSGRFTYFPQVGRGI